MCQVPFHARLFGPWLAAAAVLVLGQDAADKAKFGDPINVLGSVSALSVILKFNFNLLKTTSIRWKEPTRTSRTA